MSTGFMGSGHIVLQLSLKVYMGCTLVTIHNPLLIWNLPPLRKNPQPMIGNRSDIRDLGRCVLCLREEMLFLQSHTEWSSNLQLGQMAGSSPQRCDLCPRAAGGSQYPSQGAQDPASLYHYMVMGLVLNVRKKYRPLLAQVLDFLKKRWLLHSPSFSSSWVQIIPGEVEPWDTPAHCMKNTACWPEMPHCAQLLLSGDT